MINRASKKNLLCSLCGNAKKKKYEEEKKVNT